jgi:hypothetical protein
MHAEQTLSYATDGAWNRGIYEESNIAVTSLFDVYATPNRDIRETLSLKTLHESNNTVQFNRSDYRQGSFAVKRKKGDRLELSKKLRAWATPSGDKTR